MYRITVGVYKKVTSVGLFRQVKRCFTFSALDMASKDGELRVFIVAGEVSGDAIGARLMSSLKNLSPFPTRFAGVGGVMMSKQGLKSLFPMEDIAVMGIWELLPHLHKFRVCLEHTVKAAELFQPHVVVTIDSKGFTFRLLKQLRVRYAQQGLVGPPQLHYVAPSFWAWKGGEKRLRGLAQFVDHVLCILPFEEEVCKLNGLPATFVGHPTLEDVLELKLEKNDAIEWEVLGNAKEFRSKYGISSGSTIVTLLPGSRLQEVTRMLSVFSSTMELLKSSITELTAVIHVAPNRHVEDYISKVVDEWHVPVVLIPGEISCVKYDAFAPSSNLLRQPWWIPSLAQASRVALCTSGTVALELQLAQLPCVVAYRAHLLTELFIRYKAKISYISLPNIILNSSVIPEALFTACTPSKLAPLLMNLINNQACREEQIAAGKKVIELLRPMKRLELINSGLNNPKCVLHYDTPSSIAAHTVLYTRRIV